MRPYSVLWGVFLGVLPACGGGHEDGAARPPEGQTGEWTTAAVRANALGSLDGLSPVEQSAFTPGPAFAPLPMPGPHDWLANHREPGQTFHQFLRAQRNEPVGQRRVIYLQPLGAFPEGVNPSLSHLRAFAEAYFQLSVTVLPVREIEDPGFTTRRNPHTGNTQVLAPDVLRWLTRVLPGDGFCILAITMTDLYPEPSWNFVFGQASLDERVGVFSFARYDPRFYGEERGADYRRVLLRRSCKVLAHEAGHMFGMHHCIYYACGMTGSNHLGESDARPVHLCPICLRKLHASVGFDMVKRYQALERFYTNAGLEAEAAWIGERLPAIRDG